MKSKYIIITTALLSLFVSCEKMSFEKEPENNPVALFEDLWTTFHTDYAGFEQREVDWEAQYGYFRPKLDENTSDEKLISLFKQLLRTLDDGHVSLSVPAEKTFYSNLVLHQGIGTELLDLNLIKNRYMEGEFNENEYGLQFQGEIGNIGYLYIYAFADNLLDMNNILDSFKDRDGMIIDLRGSIGGDFTYVLTECGRLTEEDRMVFRSRTKNGTGKDDYSDWFEWYLSPSGEYFDKSIVVLTDRLTVSAAERALLIWKTLPNVTIVGDTTNGAISTKISKELANGWNYALAPQQIEFIDGVHFEGRGIPPDVYIKNTLEELSNGQDRVLEEALQILQTELK